MTLWTRLTCGLVGILVCSHGLAACPVTHFSQAHEAARLALGTSEVPRMAYIPNSVVDGDNPGRALQLLCRIVAEALQQGSAEVDNFAIASVDDTAEMSLLNCIAEANRTIQLPLLRFVFVGNPAHEADARAIVEAWGARFYFVSDRSFESSKQASCDRPRGQDEPSGKDATRPADA